MILFSAVDQPFFCYEDHEKPCPSILQWFWNFTIDSQHLPLQVDFV
jgi:hypothetical protein